MFWGAVSDPGHPKRLECREIARRRDLTGPFRGDPDAPRSRSLRTIRRAACPQAAVPVCDKEKL